LANRTIGLIANFGCLEDILAIWHRRRSFGGISKPLKGANHEDVNRDDVQEGADANGPAEAEYLQTLRRGSTH
jgi:hypothetical protein